MSQLEAAALIVILGAIAVAATAWLAIELGLGLARWRRRQRRRNPRQPLSDREVADALAPFGADISIWPSRAPRNGTTHDPIE
jgi:hypothetical protein